MEKQSVCVQRLKSDLCISSIKDFQFYVENGSTAIISNEVSRNDGFLYVNSVVPNAKSLHKCLSCGDGDQQREAVLVVGQDGTLSILRVPVFEAANQTSSHGPRATKPDILWTCPAEKLLKGIAYGPNGSVPEIRLLSAESNVVSLLVGKQLCQLSILEGAQEEPIFLNNWALSWEGSGITEEEEVVQARLKKGFLFVLHQTGNISIFSIQYQRLVASVNHNDFIHSVFVNSGILESQDMGRPCHFDVSPDLQNILVAYGKVKYGLYRINLAEYFSRNPSHVLAPKRHQPFSHGRKRAPKSERDEDEQDFTRGATPVTEKGIPTNRSWWNYLDALKFRLTIGNDRRTKGSPSTTPNANETQCWRKWFLIAEGQLPSVNPWSVSSQIPNRNPKAPITGFQRSKEPLPGRPQTGNLEDRNPRVETRADSLVSTAVRTPKLCKTLALRGIYASNLSAVVWYGGEPGTSRHGGLLFLDFSKNATRFDCFQEPTLVSLSVDPTQPHTLLSRSEVRLLSVAMEQEGVVNKMMVYKSAAVTEALCHLNSWDHCSIPIHALEIGLKHRQLDTIAFFLKSRENMFRLKQIGAESSASSATSQRGGLSTPSSSTDAAQLWVAMDLLSLAVATNIGEPQSRQYALQLLNLTLDHLNKLILNATESLRQSGGPTPVSPIATGRTPSIASSAASADALSSPAPAFLASPSSSSAVAAASINAPPSPSTQASFQAGIHQTVPMAIKSTLGEPLVTEGFRGSRHDLEETLRKLIGCTVKLRGHLKGAPQWLFPSADDTDAGQTYSSESIYPSQNRATEAMMNAWKSMTPEEIIQSAIIQRQIPLAQAFLRRQQHRLGEHQAEVSAAVEAMNPKGLPLLIDTGLVQVYNSLLCEKTERAYTMLQNMGFNVTDEIRKICLYTANTRLRDFLASELKDLQGITSEEEEMIAFVHQLEHLYTCQSFEKARMLAAEKSNSSKENALPAHWLPPADQAAKKYLSTAVTRGDIVGPSEPVNSENFHYGHVVLAWVRSWDRSARDRILLERLLTDRSKDASLGYSIEAESAWAYLTSHHHWDQLQLWIRSSLAFSPDYSRAQEEALSVWLRGPRVSPGAVHQMETCSAYLREKILDELARHGVFSPAELSTFDLLTRRLSSTRQLFKRPHPLGQRSETASVTPAFKQWFLEKCISQELPGLLWAFLDFYSLCLSENEVMSLQLPLAHCPWLEILLHFRWLGRQVTDPSLVFQASLSNARLLLKVAQPTLTSLLDAGHPIIAIATLLYAPGSIPESLLPARNDEEKQWKLDADRLKQALRPYPKLLAAVFPTSRPDGLQPQDITVYQLLQGNAPFDCRRLFLWQSTNNVASPEDVSSEMPYFSDPALIERYAYSEAFSFTYYLRQGRPSFALVTLITSLLHEGGILTKKRLFEVYVKAYTTALRHFTQLSVCAACAAFVEMLGRDSLSLRIDLQTARTVADHLKGQLVLTAATSRSGRPAGVKGQASGSGVSQEKTLKEKKEAVDRDIVNLMMSCVKGSKPCAMSMSRKLEEALACTIDTQQIERVSWKAAEVWNLAVMFCRLHGITMTTIFPRECTMTDNWLLFTCFVQAHQYPKQQVLDLVRSFRSSTIREHMSHALSHLQHGPSPSQDGTPPTGGMANGRARLPIRDYRVAYYAKMGFLGDVSGATTATSDTDDEEEQLASKLDLSQDDTASITDDSLNDLELKDAPHELFEIVYQCSGYPTPWKAFLTHSILLHQPVLSAIAACHQGANILDCLCSWLYTALYGETSLERVVGPVSFVRNHSWNLAELRHLIDIAIATGKVTLLTKAFQIFDTKGVLNSFLIFCENFLVLRNRNQCKIDLEFFHEAILTCRRRSSMRNQPDLSSHRPRVGHLQWFQETANHVARNMLLACTSQWEVGFLLEVFTAVNFSHTVESTDEKDPDYSKLYKLHIAVQGTGLELSMARILAGGEVAGLDAECRSLLEKLQALKMFDQAREVALAAGLSTQDVVIQKILSDLSQLMESEIGATEVGRIAFWVKCSEVLAEAKVDCQKASSFFQEQARDAELTGHKQAREKALLLGLAYQWFSHKKSAASKSALHALEQEVWLWRLKAVVEKKKAGGDAVTSLDCLDSPSTDWTPKSRGPRELLYNVADLALDQAAHSLCDEDEIGALDDMINQLLSSCCVAQAHRLAAQFGHAHCDLSVTLACLQLMQGRVRSEGVDPSVRALLKTQASRPRLVRRPSNLMLLGPPGGAYGARAKKPLQRSPSVVSLGINQELSLPLTDETLTTMESLAGHTSAARSCCDRIVNVYRISQVLGRPYDALIKQVPFTTVKALLQSSHPDRYLLAKAFIRANSLADHEVVNFLSDVVMTNLQQKMKKRKESSLSRPAPSDGISPERLEKVTFMSLAKMCKDPASLGSRLLEEATQISHSDLSTTRPALNLEVELIVRAHDCFTLSCNMEGIASVLRAACDCSNALTQAEEYSLMVRLLIGVRRFSEMTYIFEILRANHQMEALLKRGANDDKLKVALLDFLKRCDPPDTETYGIVALKFEMHREVASLLEQDAKERLKTLRARNMDTNIEIQNILESVLHDLTNAAKNYAKDNCLRHAEQCIKQARLVALQIHLLPVRSKVINLDTVEVAKFVTQHPKFHEALIVQNAYLQKSEWSAALFNNVVLQGNFRYLEDLQSCMQLTPSHFGDVAARYRQLTSKSSLVASHMQRFLVACPDVLTAYRLANQLELKDYALSLLKGDAGAYLSDVA